MTEGLLRAAPMGERPAPPTPRTGQGAPAAGAPTRSHRGVAVFWPPTLGAPAAGGGPCHRRQYGRWRAVLAPRL